MPATTTAPHGLIQDWPDEPRQSAESLIDYYGEPDEATASFLIWFERAQPWKRTVVSRQSVRHDFPSTHMDHVEQTIDYRVPVGQVDALAAFDRSIIVDGTRGELSARCGGTSKNFLAINLAVDVVEGRRSVEEARQTYADVAKRFDEGDKDRLTQEFTFDLPKGDTADPDVPVS
jgi:hypothetical protein